MSRLLFLFVVAPVVELVLLIEIGQRIGTLATPRLPRLIQLQRS